MRRRALLQAAGAMGAASLLPAPAIGQASRANTLRFVPHANLTVLDPVFTTAGITNEHGYLVFDFLYAMDRQQRIQPQMAEGHTISDDGRSWTIKLRPGLRFHDNEPVRSIDAKASIQRWTVRDPFGQLVGRALDGIDTPDDRTLVLKLKRPFPRLLNAIGKAVTPPFVMPERIAKTDANTPVTEMVGSGPYRFNKDEFVPGARVAYARFDGYQPRDGAPDWLAGGRRGWFERIEWHILPDPATAGAALRAGEIDWWEWGLPDLLPQLARDPSIRVQVTDQLGLYSILRFNMNVPPFNNAKLRRAIVEAVDQNDFMLPISANDPQGYRTCFAMIPCGLPHVTEAGAAFMTPPRDLEKSRAAVKAAGYNGEKVVILNPTDLPSLNPLGVVAADLLKKLGMNVDLQEMDWGTVVQRRNSVEPVEKGGWSIFPTNGGPLIVGPPPLNIYIRGQGAKGWVGNYDNPEIERLVEAWLDASTDAEQDRIYAAIQQSAFDAPPIVPLGQYYPKTAFRKDIVGVQDFVLPTPWSTKRA
jgi:peptide/nickel transport system substrate-binding protein